jgi:hypothetical protein
MIKTLTIALLATSFAGSAFAAQSHRGVPADAAAYSATYDRQHAAPVASQASAPREDFGSFGAGATARALGY